MVVGAFPIAKLSVLLVKQVSKPIANICKENAKNSPFFRTYVCMPPAQFYNWCEVKAKMWILNLGRPVNIPVLSQEMAIELGANLLGESVIFVIGAGLLILEYNRQSKKETAKEAKKEQEMKHITDTITDLYFTVQQQQTQLRELERLIHTLPGSKPSPPIADKPIMPPPHFEKENEEPNGQSPAKVQNISNIYSEVKSQTPYPDRGIILKSLNYLQMDVFSSTMFSGEAAHKPLQQPYQPKHSNTCHRESALLTETLHTLENDFRSLF